LLKMQQCIKRFYHSTLFQQPLEASYVCLPFFQPSFICLYFIII
jgi:hypothetical protein